MNSIPYTYFDLFELILVFIFIFLAKYIRDKITKFDDDHELFTNDNPALGIAKAGYYLALFITFRALFIGEGLQGWVGLCEFALYGIINIVLINLSNFIVETCVLYKFKIYHQICDQRNEAVAWVLCGAYLSSASVLAGAMSGDDHHLIHSAQEVLFYYLIGQCSIIITAYIFYLKNKSHHQYLENSNTAYGISFGSYILSIGLLIGHQGSGNLSLTPDDLLTFSTYSVLAVILFISFQYFFLNRIFSGKFDILKEVQSDKNRAAGWIIAMSNLGLAFLINAFLS